MSKSEWQAKLAGFVALYEAGAYTTNEFFWFALPFFDGQSADEELWGALPQKVRECFLTQVDKGAETDTPADAALAEKLSMVRRVAIAKS